MASSSPIRITSLPGSVRYERRSHPRLKILQATDKRPHRYRWIRALTMTVTLGALFAVPLSGLAAFDLYGAEHRALFAPATPFVGIVAVAVAIFGFYFVTFQTNLVAGRMFCGWGCPVGQLNRLADATFAAKRRARLVWNAAFAGFALVLALAFFLWWVSPAVFAAGPLSIVAIGAVLLVAATFIAAARHYGWAFCEKVCPIGLYYSVIQTQRPLGIIFDADKCQHEAACVKACPVHLEPRDLSAPKVGIGGFALEGLAANNHCLRCGACVEACELVTSKIGEPALSFGRPAESASEPAANPSPIAAPIVLPARLDPEDVTPAGRVPAIKLAAAIAVPALAIAAYAIVANGARYRPTDTWIEASKSSAPRSRYRAAAADFVGHDLEGRVTKGGAPVAGAIVFWPSPEPGAALSPAREVGVLGAAGAWPARDLVATSVDTLTLDNQGSELHTFHLAKDGRTIRQLPAPPRSKRQISAPPPGVYELRCDAHAGEQVRLLIVDHPYFATTDEHGDFSLHQLPIALIELTAVGEGSSIELSQGPSRP